MSARRWRFLVLLPWGSLALLLGLYLLVWKRLPAALAVQFDLSGTPTNMMSRGAVFGLETSLLLFVLLRYSLKLWDGWRDESRVGLLSYYLAVAVVTGVFLVLLKQNL